MCMCEKPNVNGEPGYCSTYGAPVGVCLPNPPELRDGDDLLYDEPGRCGGLDSHAHHHRLVRRHGLLTLLTRNGSGDHEIAIGRESYSPRFDQMDSDERYWTLNTLYRVTASATRQERDNQCQRWRLAAIQNRIKVNRRKKIPTVDIIPAD